MERWIRAVMLIGLLSFPAFANAGYVELSLGLNYNRSNYSADSFTWNRRWGLNFGYHFTEVSGIEFGFQDAVDRTKITGYEDTTIHDRIYSATWIQALLGKDYGIQPFVKAGIAQLNREATGFYAGGSSPPNRVDAVTAVLGAGTRVFLTKRFAVRSEATSYLQGGSIRKWRDNIAITAGISWYF